MVVGVGGSRGRAVEGGGHCPPPSTALPGQVAPLHPIAQIRHQAGSTISYQHHRYIHCCRCCIFYCPWMSLCMLFLHLLSTTSSPSSLLYSVHIVGLIISRSTARMLHTCSMQWAIEQVLKSLCQRMTTAPSCDLHHVSILQFYLGLFLDCHSICEVYGI